MKSLSPQFTGAQAARVLACTTDVDDPDAVAANIAAVDARFGRIDALVNNAGAAVFKPILETSYAGWRRVLCTQAVAPVMLRSGGGSVVNIASISGLRPSTLGVAYGTSKGALIHLTKQQACELGDAGIRVNAVAPGPVLTEMAKKVHSTSITSDYFDAIPLNRCGTQEEIAEAFGFQCGAAASYVNVQVLAVDGGFDASGVGYRRCGARGEIGGRWRFSGDASARARSRQCCRRGRAA